MRVYAVLDTNVLVSALLRGNSVPGAIAAESLIGRIIPLLHEEIIAEYRDVLHRPKFHFPPDAVDAFLNGLIKRGIFVDSTPLEEYLPDPDDAVFYEVVMEARKEDEAYLITGNLKHFPARSFIVTPKEMLEILEEKSAADSF